MRVSISWLCAVGSLGFGFSLPVAILLYFFGVTDAKITSDMFTFLIGNVQWIALGLLVCSVGAAISEA